MSDFTVTEKVGIYTFLTVSSRALFKQILIQPDWEFLQNREIENYLNPLVQKLNKLIREFSTEHRELVGKIKLEFRVREFIPKLTCNTLISFKSKRIVCLTTLSDKGKVGNNLVAIVQTLRPWYTYANLKNDQLPLSITLRFVPFEFKITPYSAQEQYERLFDESINQRVLKLAEKLPEEEGEDLELYEWNIKPSVKSAFIGTEEPNVKSTFNGTGEQNQQANGSISTSPLDGIISDKDLDSESSWDRLSTIGEDCIDGQPDNNNPSTVHRSTTSSANNN